MKTEEAASGASEEVPSEMETSTTICESFTKLDGQIELEISQESESRGFSQFSNGSRSPVKATAASMSKNSFLGKLVAVCNLFYLFLWNPKVFLIRRFWAFFQNFRIFQSK